jgi:hypothetical protein
MSSKSIINTVTDFFDPSTNSISGKFQDGVFRGSGSITGGYCETMLRLQAESKGGKEAGMLGGFAKDSVVNVTGRIGVGNDDVAASLKGVGDVLTATAQAGVQYRNGVGVAAKAKASVLSGRATVEFNVFGWEIEVGVTGDLLSAGAEVMAGYFPNEGFKVKANASLGAGGGFLFRIRKK